MRLVEAIESVFSRYRDISGRASRSVFWWWLLYANVAIALPVLMWLLFANFTARNRALLTFASPAEPGNGTVWATRLLLLLLVLPTGALIVRRLHDTNRSGRWLLVALVPVLGTVGLMALAAMPESRGPNQYGEAPKRSAIRSSRRAVEPGHYSGTVRTEIAV